jgi:hypothetical protein
MVENCEVESVLQRLLYECRLYYTSMVSLQDTLCRAGRPFAYAGLSTQHRVGQLIVACLSWAKYSLVPQNPRRLTKAYRGCGRVGDTKVTRESDNTSRVREMRNAHERCLMVPGWRH